MFLLACVGALGVARADPPGPDAIEAQRTTLVEHGLAGGDEAFALGDRARARCPARRGFCELASAAYDLAASRLALARAEALAAALGVSRVRLEGESGLARARARLPAAARDLEAVERRLAHARAEERPELATLVRLRREGLLTDASTALDFDAIAARRVAHDPAAPLARARAVAAAAAASAARDDDAYVAAHRPGSARTRARDRVTAATTLERSLTARIVAIPEGDRVSFAARLEAARAVADVDARLDLLLDLEGDLSARGLLP